MAGRTIAVTGAASGIGLALVQRLLAEGEQVVAIDRAACPAPVTRTVIADLTDPVGLRAALATVHRQLHGLANVAGVPGTAPARTVLEVNVLGARLVTEALRPLLTAGSSVVNVASVAARRDTLGEPALTELLAAQDAGELEAWLARYPLSGAQAYDTSKAALVAWTKRLDRAWRPGHQRQPRPHQYPDPRRLPHLRGSRPHRRRGRAGRSARNSGRDRRRGGILAEPGRLLGQWSRPPRRGRALRRPRRTVYP